MCNIFLGYAVFRGPRPVTWNAHSCSLNKFNFKLESLTLDKKGQCEHSILTGTLSVHLLLPTEIATEMCVGNIMCNYNQPPSNGGC